MAIRFGGRYSPGAKAEAEANLPARAVPGKIHHRLEGRTTWITVAGVPFLLGAFFQDPVGMATNLAGFGILAGGMFMTRQGLQAEAAYDARRIARRPAIPRKLFGGVLTGLGLAVGAVEPGTGAMAGAGVIGLMGAALHWFSFGPDPMKDKGMEGIDPVQQDRVARFVEEAEGYLAAMRDAILRTRDRGLEARVERFAGVARGLFRRVEEDPGDLTAARRYLGVYLMGARDATVKFVDLYVQTQDASARAAWEALIADLETNFAARTRSLMQGSRADMDIEIEVLRDRLAREGVRVPQPAPEPEMPRLEGDRGQRLDDLLHETGWKERR
ncbi:hypothetical protein GI374_03015 [Paracoccus sp. S-4012]|uniref:5-bromo-4-chloroindolyl phosphate hydrolysis family protein n=1 Tax=Paracoccus sp. S-4012 TaxID=2665648 RepID=UPI0012AFA02A|nr:5-bromo-4-chloroindolyl phosphate hydrolysis family protein [Paracoccus sp. S-4012]MRX49433.1 hypothetical protein [Paracoccus sp. S-4012]